MATRARWGGLRPDPYNPDAFDADGDGIVQEGTAFERPAFTVIVNEFGKPLQANLRSDTRPQNWRIVDRDTGRDVPYVPSYERAPTQVISNKTGTIGGRVGTLKDMVGTVGDRVATLETKTGTIVSAPETMPPLATLSEETQRFWVQEQERLLQQRKAITQRLLDRIDSQKASDEPLQLSDVLQKLTEGQGEQLAQELAEQFYAHQGLGRDKRFASRVKNVRIDGPKRATIYVDIVNASETETPIVGNFVAILRTDDEGQIEHNFVRFEESKYRGLGIAQDFFAAMERQYALSGVESIHGVAALESGPYMWARDGFDWESDRERDLWLQNLRFAIYSAERNDTITSEQAQDFALMIERALSEDWEDPLRLTPAHFSFIPGYREMVSDRMISSEMSFHMKRSVRKAVPKLSPGLPNQPLNSEVALDNLLNRDLPDFSNFGIKRIDGQQIATGINDVIKNIESKYGEINTTGTAISSLRDSFPLLIDDPFFLAKDSTGVLPRSADDTLTQYEKGIVYGFLQLAIDVPEVSSFPISFEREKAGGSCDIVLFNSNGELFQPKPAIAFGISMEDNVSASSIAMGIATNGESFRDIYDSVVSQSLLAYAYDNPEGLPDAPSVFERSNFVSAVSLALHESAHAADALAQLRDAFGEDITTDEIKEIISGDIAAQGFENIARYRYAGRFKKIAETLNQRLPFLERMQSGLSKAETEMKDAFVETFGREPNETELARIGADAFNGLMFDDIESAMLSPFGEYYDLHFDSLGPVTQETDPVALTRKNVEFHLDRIQRQAEAIRGILNNPKYRPLVSDLDFEQFIIAQGEREARAIGGVDPQAAMFWMYDSGTFMRTIDRHQDLVNDFLEEYEGSTISELIRRDFQSDDSKLEMGFIYNLALSQMDDLSNDEIESVRDFGGMISGYGGDYSASFYNNIFMSAPVEAVAEIRAAIQSGRFPDKDSAEYKAVKKLFDWIYGLGFWEKMEFKYGR